MFARLRNLLLLVGLGTAVAAPLASATVLEFGANGETVVHQAPKLDSQKASLRIDPDGPNWKYDPNQPVTLKAMNPKRSEYDDLIRDAAEDVDLPPDLIAALIQAESNFDSYAISEDGAVGLMQLMPETAARFGVTDRYEPADNILGGSRYLRWLIDNYENDVPLAIAGYNAGEGTIQKYGGLPPYKETHELLTRVTAYYGDHLELTPARPEPKRPALKLMAENAPPSTTLDPQQKTPVSKAKVQTASPPILVYDFTETAPLPTETDPVASNKLASQD